MNDKQVMLTMKRLRADAIERGMQELAITYGWSAIRIGCEILLSYPPPGLTGARLS
jgi:hypothetical protein